MFDEAVDGYLAALKFVLDWFVTSKIIKNFVLLYMQKIIYTILMNILARPHFVLMKWVFLI